MHMASRAALLAAAFAAACLLAVLLVGPAVGQGSYGKQLTIYDGHVAKVKGPWGNAYRPDANGLVPIRFGHVSNGNAASRVGRETIITIDAQKMHEWGATPCGWDETLRHEKAHARGWAHGEGRPPDGDGKKEEGENPAYYPRGYVQCHYPATKANNYANEY